MLRLKTTPCKSKVGEKGCAYWPLMHFFHSRLDFPGVSLLAITLFTAPPQTAVPFECSNGKLRIVISPCLSSSLGNVPVILHNDGPGAAIQGQIDFKFVSIPQNSEVFLEPEAPISAPETPCYFLRHVHTAMYVHPEGGTAVCGVRLVLWPGDHNHERRLMFSLRPDGNLQHVDSGLFVHPKGGKAKSGIELILHPDGPETRLAFNHDGCFRHRESGLYVHPKNGKGTKGSALIFHPDDASRAYPGELQYALEPVQIVVPPKLSLSEGRRIKLSGNLRHALSHLYVHPEGGIGISGARVILYKGGNERRLLFALRNDGCIQHVESGLFVHPRGGFAKFGVDLILHPDGPEERLAFELEPKFGCLRHIRSGLYIHPAGGEGKHGVHLVLHNDGPEQRLVYEFMPLTITMEPIDIDLSSIGTSPSSTPYHKIFHPLFKTRNHQASSHSIPNHEVRNNLPHYRHAPFHPFFAITFRFLSALISLTRSTSHIVFCSRCFCYGTRTLSLRLYLQ